MNTSVHEKNAGKAPVVNPREVIMRECQFIAHDSIERAGKKLQFACADVCFMSVMEAPRFYQLAKGHAIFRPAGELKLVEVLEMVTGAVSYARESGERRLLVVLTSVRGMQPPSATVRFRYVRDWARASGGLVRVALVTTAEMIDPSRFGVTVATNAGMAADVFVDEEKAREWLVG